MIERRRHIRYDRFQSTCKKPIWVYNIGQKRWGILSDNLNELTYFDFIESTSIDKSTITIYYTGNPNPHTIDISKIDEDDEIYLIINRIDKVALFKGSISNYNFYGLGMTGKGIDEDDDYDDDHLDCGCCRCCGCTCND